MVDGKFLEGTQTERIPSRDDLIFDIVLLGCSACGLPLESRLGNERKVLQRLQLQK